MYKSEILIFLSFSCLLDLSFILINDWCRRHTMGECSSSTHRHIYTVDNCRGLPYVWFVVFESLPLPLHPLIPKFYLFPNNQLINQIIRESQFPYWTIVTTLTIPTRHHYSSPFCFSEICGYCIIFSTLSNIKQNRIEKNKKKCYCYCFYCFYWIYSTIWIWWNGQIALHKMKKQWNSK